MIALAAALVAFFTHSSTWITIASITLAVEGILFGIAGLLALFPLVV